MARVLAMSCLLALLGVLAMPRVLAVTRVLAVAAVMARVVTALGLGTEGNPRRRTQRIGIGQHRDQVRTRSLGAGAAEPRR
jgi:hypothetical protein